MWQMVLKIPMLREGKMKKITFSRRLVLPPSHSALKHTECRSWWCVIMLLMFLPIVCVRVCCFGRRTWLILLSVKTTQNCGTWSELPHLLEICPNMSPQLTLVFLHSTHWNKDIIPSKKYDYHAESFFYNERDGTGHTSMYLCHFCDLCYHFRI